MDQAQKISHLEAQLAEKDKDIKEIAEFVFNTLKALGVKTFDDIDNVGRIAIKEMPTIIFEASVNKAKLAKRFEHFNVAKPLLEKYKHLIPQQ